MNPFRRMPAPNAPARRARPESALSSAPESAAVPAPRVATAARQPSGSPPAPRQVRPDYIDSVRPALRPERWVHDGLADIPVEMHAEKLFRWICDGMSLPREMLSWEVQARYVEMCGELMWRPHAWNMVGGRLSVYASRPRAGSRKPTRKPYIWKTVDGVRHKLRVYWFDPLRLRKLPRRDQAGAPMPPARSVEELAAQIRKAA